QLKQQILKTKKNKKQTKEDMSANNERTFIMIKPDGVQRGLVGQILQRFEQRGYKLVAMKFLQPSKELLQAHYAELKQKPFFPSLISYMLSGPVVAMVWEGKEAVKMGRQMLGQTNPLTSFPGSIRGDYCIDLGRNICHGSDSVDSANHEIQLWFKQEELQNWQPANHVWIYE
ncbi:nucleoside diphosphate kinase, putative, partial [Ichthyophthirius multifiliis]